MSDVQQTKATKDAPFSISLLLEQWLAVSHYAEEHLRCIPGTPDPDAKKGIRAIDRACDQFLARVAPKR